MIHGAHVLIQSKDAKADLAFLAEVLGRPPVVDAGGGWLIYALPPAEIAVHPSESNDVHSLYLMCDDIAAFRAAVEKMGAPCTEVHEERWGSLVQVTLPGGGTLGVYQPKHPSPKAAARKPVRRAVKKAAKRAPANRKAVAKKKAGRGRR
jgi:hypothetical protein